MSREINLRCILLLLFCAVAITSAQQTQQFKILGISVEGNKSAESVAIIANSGLKVGGEFTIPGDQTRAAITRLWGLRIFSDVQLLVENTVGDGVYLLIKVKEHPRLEKIEFKGQDALSEDDLQKKISLMKGQVVTPFELNKIVKSLKKAYEEEGYMRAEITPELVENSDTVAHGKVVLRLVINEGNEVKIGAINFYGNKAYSDGDLKGELDDTHEKVWWKFWRSAKLDKKKYADDKKKVMAFYKKNGYRDAELLTDSIAYDEKKERMTLSLFLFEGPQYKLRNITWEGNTVFKTEALSERLGFQRGEIYDMEKFEQNLRNNQDQSDVASLYLDNGYLTVSIEPEETKVGEDSLDVTIHVRERNQFRISRVDIKGNTKTKEKVIRRELYSRPGDYFSRSNIIRSIRQLSQLQYFNPEKIKPDTRFVDDKNVDVVYDVEEKSSDTFNMSVGYSGAYGFTGALGLTFNNFSLADPLSGGGGQVLAFDWQFGEASRYQTFSVSFREPWLFDTPTSFGFSLYDTRQNYYYDLRQTGGTISLGRRLRWPDDYFRADWTFRFQELDVKSASYYYDAGLHRQYSLMQTITRNSIDNPLFPSHGSTVSWSMELSGPPLLPGDAEYIKHILAIDWYTPVLNSSRVALYFGTQLGGVFRWRGSSYIPPIEMFYMGGTGLGMVSTTPLRGYEDRGVGPLTASKQVLPGLVMEKQIAELRFNVSLNPVPIYLLAFAEGGNVWSDIKTTELFDLKRSAGFGARLLINPIGLLGFDYGYGFDDANGDGKPDGWHFHFQFGKGF